MQLKRTSPSLQWDWKLNWTLTPPPPPLHQWSSFHGLLQTLETIPFLIIGSAEALPTVKSLFSAVLNLAQSFFLPPVVQAWLKIISASLFLVPGLCFCWVFSVLFFLSRLFAVLPRHVESISTTSSPRFAFQNLSASLFLPPSSF